MAGGLLDKAKKGLKTRRERLDEIEAGSVNGKKKKKKPAPKKTPKKG